MSTLSLMLLRRPKVSRLVNTIILPFIVAVLTVALACFALGAWQPSAQQLVDQPDGKDNKITGLYDAANDTFIDDVHIVFPTNAVYDGGIEGYRFNGYGVYEGFDTGEDGLPLAWYFEGNFVDGRLEGEGSYSSVLGTYEGEFANSLPNGQGEYSSASGWRYEGEFRAGSITGHGTVYLADGTSTTGLFEDGIQISSE